MVFIHCSVFFLWFRCHTSPLPSYDINCEENNADNKFGIFVVTAKERARKIPETTDEKFTIEPLNIRKDKVGIKNFAPKECFVMEMRPHKGCCFTVSMFFCDYRKNFSCVDFENT